MCFFAAKRRSAKRSKPEGTVSQRLKRLESLNKSTPAPTTKDQYGQSAANFEIEGSNPQVDRPGTRDSPSRTDRESSWWNQTGDLGHTLQSICSSSLLTADTDHAQKELVAGSMFERGNDNLGHDTRRPQVSGCDVLYSGDTSDMTALAPRTKSGDIQPTASNNDFTPTVRHAENLDGEEDSSLQSDNLVSSPLTRNCWMDSIDNTVSPIGNTMVCSVGPLVISYSNSWQGPRCFLSICSQPGIKWVESKVKSPGVKESLLRFSKDLLLRLKVEQLSWLQSKQRAPEPVETTAWQYTNGRLVGKGLIRPIFADFSASQRSSRKLLKPVPVSWTVLGSRAC